MAWTDEWERAREFLRERLAELPVAVDRDAAGNLWAVLEGDSDEIVAIGSHVDSVPSGGWLDGALGVFGALEALRSIAADGRPPRTVALVDWADEEGARFGRTLLGSSAFAGTLDLEAAAALTDADGVALPDAVAAHGVEFGAMGGAGDGRRERLAAYLELHIEQGPVLEAEGLPCGAVLGTFGVERWRAVVHRPRRARRVDPDGPARRRGRRGGARRSWRCRRWRASTVASAPRAAPTSPRASSPPCPAGPRS